MGGFGGGVREEEEGNLELVSESEDCGDKDSRTDSAFFVLRKFSSFIMTFLPNYGQ